jgi:hypothetical protein
MKGQPRTDNPEKLATFNGYSRHRMKTKKTPKNHITENENDEQHKPHQKAR